MPQTTTYGYDAHGNIVKKTMPNGETIMQTYDALNRVTKIEGQKPSAGGLLYRYGYRYDLAGNIVHIREDYSESPASWREIQQTYDRAHRLISEQYTYSPDGILGTDEGNRVISYHYDDADNRTQKSIFRFSEQEDYSYNTLNQLTHLGADERSVDYEYDLNGNRILRTEDTTITGYAYDYENRLVAVTNNTLEPAYAYNYDYRTRRVGIEAAPDTGSPATTTLSFSGGTSVQEYTDSTLNVEYIRGSDLGGGIGGILYTIRGGDPSFTHYNSRGDVVAKTDNGSTLTYQAAYEAYGMHPEETGSTLDRQKANTKDEDPTGLLNEGSRYRDLEIGEFITRDPAGFVGGPNLYTYVRQNPWSRFDPHGLNEVVISGGPKKDPNKEDSHDSNWRNYITAARAELSARREHLKNGEELEWHVQKSAYVERARRDGKDQNEYLKEIEGIAKKLGVKLRFFESAKDLVTALNTSVDGSLRSGDARISNLAYFGHGAAGGLWLKYDGTQRLMTTDLKSIDRSAFAPGCTSTSWGCNSATTDTDNPVSFVDSWRANTGVPMRGVYGRTDYAPTATPTVDRWTRRLVGTFTMADWVEYQISRYNRPQLGTVYDGGPPSHWVEPQATKPQ